MLIIMPAASTSLGTRTPCESSNSPLGSSSCTPSDATKMLGAFRLDMAGSMRMIIFRSYSTNPRLHVEYKSHYPNSVQMIKAWVFNVKYLHVPSEKPPWMGEIPAILAKRLDLQRVGKSNQEHVCVDKHKVLLL